MCKGFSYNFVCSNLIIVRASMMYERNALKGPLLGPALLGAHTRHSLRTKSNNSTDFMETHIEKQTN